MLPFFYQSQLKISDKQFVLDEDTSRHCSQVLRMAAGQQLLLTNGLGLKATAEITDPNRKRTTVTILSKEEVAKDGPQFTLAIAFTKNVSRNEWLLEKATEIGIKNIIPLATKRSEKEKFRQDRLQSILVSAMLQSQQVYLPQLMTPQVLVKVLQGLDAESDNFIAHCEQDRERVSYQASLRAGKDVCVFIGPEGDFTPEEIEKCMAAGLKPVSLGINRLRTETAGLYACTLFNAVNYG